MTSILRSITPAKMILRRPQIASPLGIIGWLWFTAAALSLMIAAALSLTIWVVAG